jgi:hypothetical protein
VIAFERLAMLARHELPQAEAEEVEDHVLGCATCAATLERLLDLGDGIAQLTRAGQGFFLSGRSLVETLEREGKVTRRYAIEPGGEVHCTVDARDVYTRLRLGLDTGGLRRVDLLYESPSVNYRIEDLPFHEGEVVFVQAAEYIRTLPTERKTVRLVAVEDGNDRELAVYTLNHTAFKP